jgi:hypothetical protein
MKPTKREMKCITGKMDKNEFTCMNQSIAYTRTYAQCPVNKSYKTPSPGKVDAFSDFYSYFT